MSGRDYNVLTPEGVHQIVKEYGLPQPEPIDHWTAGGLLYYGLDPERADPDRDHGRWPTKYQMRAYSGCRVCGYVTGWLASKAEVEAEMDRHLEYPVHKEAMAHGEHSTP